MRRPLQADYTLHFAHCEYCVTAKRDMLGGHAVRQYNVERDGQKFANMA